MQTDLDEQFLFQLSKSPLTAATDPHQSLAERSSFSRPIIEGNDFVKSPVEMNGSARSPLVEVNARPLVETNGLVRPLVDVMNTPRVENGRIRVHKESLKLPSFPSHSDGLNRTSRSDDIVPLKLFELSLESPSQSRTSIEMPSTFSKAPSAKKKVCQSSQESIFVAATQFPGPPQRSQTSLASFSDIPDTQYPANVVMTSIKDILSSIPMSSPKTAGSIVEYSQGINLFDTPQKIKMDAEINLRDNTVVNSQGSNMFDTPPKILDNLPEMDADLDLCDHTAVIFPPSEGEGIYASEAPKLPSAMKKSSKKVTPSTKKVQFAPMPVNLRYEESIIHSLGQRVSSNTIGKRLLSPATRPLKNISSPSIRSTPKSIITSSSQTISLMEEVLNSTTKSKTSQRSSKRGLLSSIGKRSLPSTKLGEIDRLVVGSSQAVESLQNHNQFTNNTEQCLSSHMMVWARWRPLQYAPAILQERLSRTRDLWKIRFCHWKDTRHKSITLEDFSPCDIRSLLVGDAVQIVRNRKRMDFRVGEFERWVDAGSISVRIDNVSEKVDLSRVVISRKVFLSLKSERCLSSNIPTSPATKRPRKTSLTEWSFWITLGNLSPSAKRTQKSQIVTRIRSLGGTVLEDDDINVNPERTVLLCNGFCRTAKTFLALVLRVPILRLDWLEACEHSKGFVSMETFAIPILNHSNTETGILQGWSIVLEGSGSFCKGWTMVCQAAGANIVPSLNKLDPTGQSRVLVDQLPSSSSRLSRWASQTGIVIVTVDWLMNSILTGRCL